MINLGTATNGKGIYTVYGTEKDRYPIYYYRGDIDYNNAKFAGFCWKIVRTTETGGTKLIYNGLPDEDGYCTATDTDTQIGTSVFNPNHQLPYDGGYMYGDAYGFGSYSGYLTSYNFSNSFNYNAETNIYQLISNTNSYYNIENHHYTCTGTSTSCTEAKYIFHYTYHLIKYIPLKFGENINDALKHMKEPKYDSIVKQQVDRWFEENMIPYFENLGESYNSYIEDTVWCNDRSFSTSKYGSNIFNPNEGDAGDYLHNTAYYDADRRGSYPSVGCADKMDSFTVSDNRRGNGALKYPIGMLTRDELVLAGHGSGYLGNSGSWWTMTPYVFDATSTSNSYLKLYNLGGNSACSTELGIRPSISIRPEVLVKEGTDGTATNPYEFLVQ